MRPSAAVMARTTRLRSRVLRAPPRVQTPQAIDVRYSENSRMTGLGSFVWASTYSGPNMARRIARDASSLSSAATLFLLLSERISLY